MVAFEIGVQICYGSPDVWPFYGGSWGQNTSQNPKHFPESKNTSQNPKILPKIQTLPRIQKHFPEFKNTSKNPTHVPEFKNTFGFWEVFGFCNVFLVSKKCFGFWEVFCPYEPLYYSVKSFGPTELFFSAALFCLVCCTNRFNY